MLPDQTVYTENSQIADACKRLAQGYCVVIPTETVYGLAADATQGAAVARIFETKGRPQFNPLICHVDGLEMAQTHGDFDPISKALARAFWPGPLTLVVPLKDDSTIHSLVTAELGTIGLRCPRGIAGELIRKFGKPLAAPSANLSGKISPTRADHVASEFPDDPTLMILDNGPAEVGLESTIVKVENRKVLLLRPGSITPRQIEEVVGILPEAPSNTKILAPGMMQSHYAPQAKVRLNCTGGYPNAGWLLFGENGNQDARINRNLSPRGDLREAAANLYHHLKELDRAGVDEICVAPIANTGLGMAINDRLTRAAAPRNHDEP